MESFVMYRSFHEALKELTREQYGNVMYAINEYALNGIEPEELTGIEKAIFLMAKPQLDANSKRRENGAQGGRPRKETEKPMVIENENQEKPMVIENDETEKPNVNDNVNVNVNDNANTHTEEIPEYIKKTEKMCVSKPKDTQKLTKEIFELVTEHNKSAPPDKKVPIAPDIWQFTNKQMLQLLSATGTEEPPEKIKQALMNFLQIAKSDTWQKTFTWTTFCRHYVEYTPEYFAISRYLNETPDTEDATKKPENVFYFAHKDDPRFIMRAFRDYKDEWEKAGRPDGEAYYKLQTEWVKRGPPPDRKYKTYEQEA